MFLLILLVVVIISVFIGLKLRSASNKVKHIEGMSLLDFVRDPTNFQRNLFNRWSEKRPTLFKMNGPGFTAVLATHPDSAKVRFLEKYYSIKYLII